MFFLTVGFIKLFVALFPRYGYLQLLAILRMREYSHTNICDRYSNSGTGTGTLATAKVKIMHLVNQLLAFYLRIYDGEMQQGT